MTADCPSCESDVFVHRGRHYEHYCEACAEPFGDLVNEFVGFVADD